MVVVAVASLTLMAILYDPHTDPSRIYYGTDTRAAQLLFGAMLAFAWPLGRMTGEMGRGAGIVLDGVGAVGLAVLAWAFFGWQDYDRLVYQGGLAIVALASVAVIACLVHPRTRIAKVFGLAPFVWIGQRSYAIYLFHWPIMALTRPGIDLRWNATLVAVLQIALSVGLAALSYKYVEMPVRRGQALPWIRSKLDGLAPRQRLGMSSAVAVVAVLLVAFPFVRHASKEPVPGEGKPVATAAATAKTPRTRNAGQVANGPLKAQKKLPPLAVGASVMLAASPALQQVLGPKATIDAAVGRQASDIAARIEAYALDGDLPDKVVIQVGENGPLTKEDMDRLHADLRGISQVVFVNVRVPRNWQDESNAVLKAQTKHWKEATIADWYDASANPSLLYDGAHPNDQGQQVYANVVRKALKQSK
jgi:hypothetical protein